MIKTLCKYAYKIAGYIGATFLAIMMVVLCIQVFSRYVLNHSLTWAEEFIRYLEVWIVFLGASLCVKDDTHPTVTIVANLFPKRVQFYIKVMVNIAIFAVGLVMIVSGHQFVMKYVKQLTPTLRISIAWIYAAIPISGILINIQTIGNLSNVLVERKKSIKEVSC